MKNQYFGDVNDYRKYGLIRALLTSGRLSLTVGWMLTPDDGSNDGRFHQYLRDQNNNWGRYDLELFDCLIEILPEGRTPTVRMAEKANILPPRSRFFSELVPDGKLDRDKWGKRLVMASSGTDLVFLDPDNGLEIPSKPIGRKSSSKYAAWNEIKALWENGCSLLIYQHYCREERSAFTDRLTNEIRQRIKDPFVAAFATPHVLFLLSAQPSHSDIFKRAMESDLARWRGQIELAKPIVG